MLFPYKPSAHFWLQRRGLYLKFLLLGFLASSFLFYAQDDPCSNTSTLSVTREDGTTVSFTSGQKDLNATTDDYAIFEGTGSEDTFEIPLGNTDTANLNVFVDGEPQTSGVDYNIVSGNVVFTTAPISGDSINLIDIGV